ncbi:hypothetical protein C8J57DRAFT_1248048 [Mycena rebaudengoi]|nr:hypothetical protein C8J57DRAFT_1248048 [Mycena rebaudengoi]
MAFDTTGKWLAIGYNNEVLIVRQSSISTWSNERKLTALDFEGNKDITRALQFHTREKLLLVTYLFGGIVLLAVTDLSNCIRWYDTANEKLVSTTKHGSATNDNVILPVTFIGPNIIVVGSATGEVAIFKSGNHHPLQLLLHNGISEQFEECTLNIWISKEKKQIPRSSLPWKSSIFVLGIAVAGLYTARDYKSLKKSVKSGIQKTVQDIRALNQISRMKEPDLGKIVNPSFTPFTSGTEGHVAAEDTITQKGDENLD